MKKTRIYTAFMGEKKPVGVAGWPNAKFDPDIEHKNWIKKLAEDFGDEFEFIGGDLVPCYGEGKCEVGGYVNQVLESRGPKALKDMPEHIREGVEQSDGVLVVVLCIPGCSCEFDILDTGKPTVVVNNLFAGDGLFLHCNSFVKRNNLPAILVSSSDKNDTRHALHMLTVMKRMRETIILDYMDEVSEWGMKPDEEKVISDIFGTEIILKSGRELLKHLADIDDADAQKIVQKWMQEAEKVVEPTEKTMLKAAQMYLALKRAMEEVGATCVSTDCLNYVYRDKFPGYPCMAFFQLMNDGLMGVCEADVFSALTNLMGQYLTGSPGFVSDPVIDTATNQVIYAHCVCSNKMLKDKTAPYIVRSHAECDKGASVQVIAQTGLPMTTIKLHPVNKKLALHKGIVVGNVNVDWACRTKIAVEVPDAKILLNNWNVDCNFGWHRVSFYGDLEEDFRNLATLYGLTVIENS
ncbi:MAG: hypothetical protein K8S87_03635 [Planctomycetes bacterium]|nr:hypothetical protein [Planctomycetota bacterium]